HADRWSMAGFAGRITREAVTRQENLAMVASGMSGAHRKLRPLQSWRALHHSRGRTDHDADRANAPARDRNVRLSRTLLTVAMAGICGARRRACSVLQSAFAGTIESGSRLVVWDSAARVQLDQLGDVRSESEATASLSGFVTDSVFRLCGSDIDSSPHNDTRVAVPHPSRNVYCASVWCPQYSRGLW